MQKDDEEWKDDEEQKDDNSGEGVIINELMFWSLI